MYGTHKTEEQRSIGNGYIINCYERPITKIGRRGRKGRGPKEEKEVPLF